jgi:hypothetical protein
LYKADEWARGELRDGFPLGSLELEGWKGGQLRSDKGHLQRKFTATDKSESPSAFVVEALVGNSTDDAQKQLLVWLAGRQAPEPAASAQERDLNIGDVGYLGLAGPRRDTIAWLAFVRGNVAVRIRNANFRANPELDLGAIARTLDESISQRSSAEPGVPTIEKLSSDKRQVRAGDVVRLDVAVADPAGGMPHIHWVVGGTGQGYVEADQDNTWYLHTTGAGDISLVLEVTGSTGTFAEKEIKISVTK